MSCLKHICCPSLKMAIRIKSCEGINKQFVRYRKPRFVPVAKSKIYRVKPPTKRDPEEMKVLQQWEHNYRTEIKTVRTYLVVYQKKLEARYKIAAEKEPFEQRYATMNNKNEQWNKETGILKKQAVDDHTQMVLLREKAIFDREEMERSEMLQQAKQKVIDIKEHQEDYITPDTIDDYLENLLSSRSDHNYALYLDGTKTTDEENKDIPKETNKPDDSDVNPGS